MLRRKAAALRRSLPGTAGLLAPLVLAGAALAAEAPDRRTVLAARDEVFARPEFAAPAERGESLVVTALKAFADAVAEFQARYPVAYVAVMIVLVLTLLILVAHIVWTLSAARRARYDDDEAELPELDIRRTPPVTFRSRAVALAEEGRYEDAARELYTALVLALDARGDVAYARHKALLDYRLEARRDDARTAFELFAGGYHPASFGRRQLPEERFRELLTAVDEVSS